MNLSNITGYGYTAHTLYSTDTGAVIDPTTPPTAPDFTLEYALNDVIDDAHSLIVKFTPRVGTQGANLYDIMCSLTWQDPVTNDILYQIAGTLAALPTGVAGVFLGDAANNSGFFNGFELTMGTVANPATSFLGTSNPAGNPVGSFTNINSQTLTVAGDPGATSTPTTAFLAAVVQELTTGDVNPDYIGMTDLSNLQVISAMQAVQQQLNCHLLLEADGTVDPADEATVITGLSLADYRSTVYYNGTIALPRDAQTTNVPKVWRPTLGVQLAYRLLRNATATSTGIPPINYPVAGASFPLNFKGIEAAFPLDETALNTLAQAGINPILKVDGTYQFYDCITQYGNSGSQLYLTNSAEIETFTTNKILAIIRKNLMRPMTQSIKKATREALKFLDDCVTAGLLVPSQDLNGACYTFAITPDVDRPYDAVVVNLARRCEGAARAAYLNTSVDL